MCFVIKSPDTKEEFEHYFHLRWKILRAPWNQVEGTERDELEDQCFHLIAIDAHNDIIGVARLQFNTAIEAQIRYMAVEEKHERKGIGSELLKAMEQQAIATACEEIILDAREPAIDFYEKAGYRIIKKSYLLFDSIQHYQMKKTFSKV